MSLVAGAVGAPVAALACIWWTLRSLSRTSERSLLAGRLAGDAPAAGRQARTRPLVAAIGFGVLGAALIVMTSIGALDRTGAFFGAGGSLLVACLCLVTVSLRRPIRHPLEGGGWWSVSRLGLRNAAERPGRSVLAIAVIAAATFILISVDAFRRDWPAGDGSAFRRRRLPGARRVAAADGSRSERTGRTGAPWPRRTRKDVSSVAPFRLLPGDDTSCLNLYEPRNPRILGASRGFIEIRPLQIPGVARVERR